MSRNALKDYLRESRLFRNRIIVTAVAVVLLLGALVTRLVVLQVINHQHFTTLSQENRVDVRALPPTRGLIYDRNGVILAQNLPTFSLEVIPEQVKDLDATLQALGKIIEISESDYKSFKGQLNQQRRFNSIPIRVRLDQVEVAKLAANRHRFPGVEIEAKLLRHYPLGEKTAHVVGYVGRINQEELQRINEEEQDENVASSYSGTSHIGKTGVEKSYESILHGKVGVRQVEVNALGRIIRVLHSEPPEPGQDLHLSLDIGLQSEAIAAFGEERGAAVAIDPRNGAILALVSNPGFDPNLFVEGISSSDYKMLQQSKDKPLFNRALRGQYPPGSTVKPFIGLAGLETGTLNSTQKNYCPGFYQLPGHSHKYRDWRKGGHGSVNLIDAVTQSCDVYFYALAHQLGIDRLHEFLSRFGFGRRTKLDIEGERTGLLPSREWKKRVRKQPWYPGETLIAGIGQGYFLATPLQLAHATATLAARGVSNPPWVVQTKGIKYVSGAMHERDKPTILQQRNPNNWIKAIEAMTQVIEGARGTARALKNENYRIAGKTGTAQVFSVKQDEEYDEEKVEKEKRDHALFIAFAPVEEPRIAVAVVVENGGHGGSVAAPIAKRIMDYHLLKK
ncbi:MAG: penicillin-binding protein 2 [Gammaproteobacteria bacterium]|nr:penicillin-binding protein 2 [Gammaproteobacteria bacterium]MCP5418464.1 penicillin-binding protein 2 [Chromatiaceae bacterium]